MSEVRMCDVQRSADCLQIFSVKERGWQKVKSEVVEEDSNGKEVVATVNLDACPQCAMAPLHRPRLRAIQAPEAA